MPYLFFAGPGNYVNHYRLHATKAEKKALKKAKTALRLSKNGAHKCGGHTWYGPKDFTKEEITRRNILAFAVLNEGQRVCKGCGKGQGVQHA